MDSALLAAAGFGNTAADVFERGGPYLVRGAADLLPTAQLLDTYSPELFCTVRNYAQANRLGGESLGNNGYSLQTTTTLLGAENPYVYPDNLPRVNARGGPGGAPGCWQSDRPRVVAGAVPGDGHRCVDRAVQPLGTRSADPHRVRLGPPSRGEHDQPMKITGTAIKLGVFSLVLLLFTGIIIVVFGQIRFDRTNKYTAEFSSASGLRAGQFVRASGVEVGKVSKVRLVDGGQRVQVDFNVDRSLPLYQSTTAQIRYQDLIGNRYLELAAR